jgi:hypothetical protein
LVDFVLQKSFAGALVLELHCAWQQLGSALLLLEQQIEEDLVFILDDFDMDDKNVVELEA